MNDYRIRIEDVMAATEGGKSVILHYYPQSSVGFSGRRNFSIRGRDDRKPSCTVFQKDGTWFLQDKGGSDTKAYNAVGLVMREEKLNFPQALEWIAGKFAPDLLADRSRPLPGQPKPGMEKRPPQQEITVERRDGGQFTAAELALLGYKITQEICDSFHLVPLVSFTTKANAKGDSWRIIANDTYPIYYYDYGTFGKIYTPLGDTRFLWTGEKPADLILGDDEFLKMYDKAARSSSDTPFLIPADPDDEESVDQDLTWKDLIICSGPSDALNVRRAGYHVCWLNSETAELSAAQFAVLKKISKKIYILYDVDDTGRERMQKIALDFLDIAIINLPADLPSFRTRKGKPCKDAKDFFMHYRRPGLGDIDQIFENMLKLSCGLKFWTESLDKRNSTTYDVNNIQMYAFLQAMGYYTIDDPGRGTAFCHIRDNRVELIPQDEMKPRCMGALRAYLEQRNLKKAMTQEFLNWAEDYFTDDRLNQLLETAAVFGDYKQTLPKAIAENMKPTSFKRKLQLFCQYKEWVFNPQALMLTKSERDRCDIRRKVMGQDRYYFYIDAARDDEVQAGVIFDAFDREQGCGEEESDTEKPLF